MPTDEIGKKNGLIAVGILFARQGMELDPAALQPRRDRDSAGCLGFRVAAMPAPAVAQQTGEKLPAGTGVAVCRTPAAGARRADASGRADVESSGASELGRSGADGARSRDRLRTVQEIKATAEGRIPANEADDDPVPVDIDEFRLALAGRIEAFVASERTAADGKYLTTQVTPQWSKSLGADFMIARASPSKAAGTRQQRRGVDRRAVCQGGGRRLSRETHC